MRRSTSGARLRAAQALTVLSGLLAIVNGCEKLVGTKDTVVTRGEAGASAASAGNAGMAGASEAAEGGAAGASTETGGGSGKGGSAGNSASGGSSGSAGTFGSAGTAGTAGSSACPCAAPTPTCENGTCVVRGPTMVAVTDLDTPYYIDSTEVTSAEYKLFQTAKGTDYSGQRAACSWNKSFAASEVNTHANWPAVNIDFCDAAAYCAWADKRLCGAIGGGALLATDPDVDAMPDTTNVSKSQWYLACGGPNGDEFPYATYEKDGYCNEQNGFGDLADVGSYTNCQGHYEGLYDMVGNVEEWIDSCDADATNTDHCAVIGGSVYSNAGGGCEVYDLELRDAQYPGVGFRCCSK